MWPTPQDYNEAVQNPGLAFSDLELLASSAECNSFGIPKPRSGSFASVYHMVGKAGDWAVRCFLHQIADQEERYAAIADSLKSASLKETVDFAYLAEGIRVKGNWYPILKMQWVDGEPLNQWLDRHINDSTAVEALAQRFQKLCAGLSDAGIAHGDLQHGNILVIKNQLKLVDYDGMFTESIAALGSNEIGHRNYQHPGRNRDDFAAYLDRFSAWSIYTSLFCLARDPLLWSRVNGGDECLLFRQKDYRAPEDSQAFRLLEHHDQAEIRQSAKTLRKLLAMKVAAVPPLGQAPADLDQLDELPPPERLPSWLIDDDTGRSPVSVGGHRASGRAAVDYQTPPTVMPTLTEAPPPITVNALTHRSSTNSPPSPSATAGGAPSTTMAPLNTQRRIVDWLGWLIPALVIVAAITVQIHAAVQPGQQSPKLGTVIDTGTELYKQAQQLQSSKHFTSAITVYEKAMAEFEAMRSERDAAWCGYQIGRCYQAQNNPKQAIAWMQKSIDTFHAGAYVPRLYAEIGRLYAAQGELNNAAFYLGKALDRSLQSDLKPDTSMAQLLKEVGMTLLLKQQPQGLDAYIRGSNYEFAAGTVDAAHDYNRLKEAATFIQKKHNPALAFRVWQAAYSTAGESPGPGNKNPIEALKAMGRIAQSLGQTDLARQCEHKAEVLASAPAAGNAGSQSARRFNASQPLFNPRLAPPPEPSESGF